MNTAAFFRPLIAALVLREAWLGLGVDDADLRGARPSPTRRPSWTR